jgi:hypothetical protein
MACDGRGVGAEGDCKGGAHSGARSLSVSVGVVVPRVGAVVGGLWWWYMVRCLPRSARAGKHQVGPGGPG